MTSKPVVGSSSNSSSGLPANAIATATLCCCPPDNSWGYLCAIISGEGNLTLFNNSEIFLSRSIFFKSVCNLNASSI